MESGAFTRLTADDFAYSDVQVSPDGETVYAMRTSYAEPLRPVRLDARTPDQQSTPLRGPSEVPALPGRLEEVETKAEDGVRVRSWLALPEGASAESPAPLLLWIHGGPLGSWNAWSWRWNPWIAVARGYAVLLPDPALSTGYGLDFIERGWGSWGEAPYTDLMAATDAAEARDDIDESRTAAMGGSFGGYMANWVAGHTDRFKAIVTHASLWALDQFGPTTDAPWYWRREMTPEMARDNSPHLSVDDITTPMLVVHGDRDYRVPIGEGLRLWAELAERAEAEDGVDAAQVPLLPRRGPLGPLARSTPVVWNADRARLPRPPRAGQGVGDAGPARVRAVRDARRRELLRDPFPGGRAPGRLRRCRLQVGRPAPRRDGPPRSGRHGRPGP